MKNINLVKFPLFILFYSNSFFIIVLLQPQSRLVLLFKYVSLALPLIKSMILATSVTKPQMQCLVKNTAEDTAKNYSQKPSTIEYIFSAVFLLLQIIIFTFCYHDEWLPFSSYILKLFNTTILFLIILCLVQVSHSKVVFSN